MNKMKTLLAAAALALGLSGQSQASVVTFNAVGNTGTILFSTTQDQASLGASFFFTLATLTQTQATFNTTVRNTSSGPGTNTLMSFGIDVVSPTLSGASTTGGIFDAVRNVTFPSFGQVDLCLRASNNCSGGAIGNGLGESGVDTFILTLTTLGSFANGISFTSPFSIKFQDVGNGGGSFEFAGCVAGTPDCGPNVKPRVDRVPEPETLALFGVALLALAATRRKS